MKEVFRHTDSARVCLYQSILHNEGIDCYTQNDVVQQSLISGLLPALFPISIFWPTLCVLHDEDYPKAMSVLTQLQKPGVRDSEDWKCASCGETVPGNFDSCWSCRGERRLASAEDH